MRTVDPTAAGTVSWEEADRILNSQEEVNMDTFLDPTSHESICLAGYYEERPKSVVMDIDISVGGHVVQALIDTGADKCLISHDCLSKLISKKEMATKLYTGGYMPSFEVASKAVIKSLGQVMLEFSIEDVHFNRYSSLCPSYRNLRSWARIFSNAVMLHLITIVDI